MHDSHSNVPVGTVWDWEIRKHPETGQDGVVFYFNIYRDGEVFERARDDILSGRKTAVSIGAEAPRGGYKCDDRGCYVERDVTDLYELSICETPANPEAYFINVGKDIAKSKQPMDGEVFRIGIKDMVVHQDYTTCPLQRCKHDLLDKGFKNVHIQGDRVIAKSTKHEFELFKAIRKMGYPFGYDLKKQEFDIVPDYGVTHAIADALDSGWAHKDQIGHVCLTKEIPKEVFIDWYERGFIVKIGDFYCLKSDDVAKENIGKQRWAIFDPDYNVDVVDGVEQIFDNRDDAVAQFDYDDYPDGWFMTEIDDAGKPLFKKVKKDGGAMGVSTAGATNAVYGSKPASLTNPDKKYGKKRKTKKELNDDGNINGPAPTGKEVVKASSKLFFT